MKMANEDRWTRATSELDFCRPINLDVRSAAAQRRMPRFFGWGNALNYRLYCFDGGGKVWTADWLSASSDAEAIALAQAMDVGVKCEIWEGKRLVTTIDVQRQPRTDGDELAPGFA